MRHYTSFWAWTSGRFETSKRISLDWRRTYLLIASLTLTRGDERVQVYISMVCNYSGGDVVLCGPDGGAHKDGRLQVYRVLRNARSVTINLRAEGGGHRMEGAILEL